MAHRRTLALGALLVVKLFVACAPECIDQADCVSKARAGEELTCDTGRCVTRTISFGLGGMTGAGGSGGGRVDAGAGGMGGNTGGAGGGQAMQGTEFDGGLYVAHLTGTQTIPPSTVRQLGSANFAMIVRIDGGVSLSWTITHGLDAGVIADAGLVFGGLAGQNGFINKPLGASLASPIVGQAFLNLLEAQQLFTGRAYVSFASTPALRGQLIPIGTRLATSAFDGGVIEFAIPVSGVMLRPGGTVSYAGDWPAIGAADARIKLGATTLATLTTTATGAQGTFIEDGGIIGAGRSIVVQPRDGGPEATGELVFH